jgi:hypothetical protein
LADFPNSLHGRRLNRGLPEFTPDDSPSTISNFTVDLLTVLRSTKIGTNAIAIIQIFALGLAGVVWK